MANESNLRPKDSSQNREEAKRNGKKGGVASGKARREKKALKETVNAVLAMPLKNGKCTDIEEIKSLAAVKGKNLTIQEAIVIAQVQKALKGDIRAAEYLRDISEDGSLDNNIEIVVTRKE